jgi:hypothetical protein
MRDLVCDYCRAPAVDTIPATPERVCRAHAELFWTGVLAEVALLRLANEPASPDEDVSIVTRAA